MNSIDNQQRREDSLKVLEIMERLTNETPKMWGTSIVGFGNYHYKYESGREGDFMKVAFPPENKIYRFI